ncbi:MAG: hypothetical protein V1909_04335 [Candidatus Micrarchaeota archaeon]
MPNANRRGQLLTTDFILSLTIFLAILLSTMSLWASVDTQIKDSESRRDMQAITTTISESLVRSQGYPKNWTNETVKMIGLANEEHVLDINKILSLKHMNYDNVSSILRLANYNYYISITDGAGYDLTSGIVRSPVAVIVHKKSGMEYAQMLYGSVVTWDLYWDGTVAGDQITLGYVNSFTSRLNYSSDTTFNLLIKLMSNQSSYRTIIIEDIGLNSTLNRNDVLYAPELKDLVNFTKRGGILIYTDTDALPVFKPLIADNFSMKFSDYPAGGSILSVVNYAKPVLLNATAGETLNFLTVKRVVYRDVLKGDPELHFIVNNSQQNDRCNICWWDVNFGRVYYIEDNQGTYNITGSTSSLTPHLNIVGENMTMGKRPSNQTTDLISVKRTVLISGFEREVANLNLVVWR